MRSFLVLMVLTVSLKLSWGYVEIYEKQNFDELAYQGNIGSACFKLSDQLPYLSSIPSMKSDQCLIAFNGDSCETNSVPMAFPKYEVYLASGDYSNLTSVFSGTSLPANTPVKSLKIDSSCRASGDISQAVFYKVEDSPDPAADEILRYQEVCGCTDLPSQIVPPIRSMLNPERCVRLFSEKNCAGTVSKIPAYVEYPDPFKTTTISLSGKKSISTCNPLPTCMSAAAEVFKVEIDGGAYEINNVTINDIDALGSLATFENRGSGMVTADYRHSHNFKDLVTVTVPENLGGLILNEASDIAYTSNAVFPSFAKTKIVDAIRKKFWAASGSDSPSFDAHQTIQIPHCQQYKVNSYVTGVQNYKVKFTVSARLTGQLASSSTSSHVLTANQLQNVAKDLGLQPTINGSSVVVKADSTIIANLGIEAVVIDESSDIQGCYDINGSTGLAATSVFTVLLFSAFSFLFKY